jgi:hypothetical protein
MHLWRVFCTELNYKIYEVKSFVKVFKNLQPAAFPSIQSRPRVNRLKKGALMSTISFDLAASFRRRFFDLLASFEMKAG